MDPGLRECLRLILPREAGLPPADREGGPESLRGWLAARNCGLVPVRDPARFTWPGSFLARLAGDTPRWVVMFGVPPGVLEDPVGGPPGEVAEAWVLSPFDAGMPMAEGVYGEPAGESGLISAIVLAARAEGPGELRESAVALPGRGLEGDRYATGEGTFSGVPGDGRALTLIEAEVLRELGLEAPDARRNVVTEGIGLNPLVGREFTLGEVRCRGARLCEPCRHLDRLTQRDLIRPLVHRGGLRADILSDGTIRVGDAVRATAPSTEH